MDIQIHNICKYIVFVFVCACLCAYMYTSFYIHIPVKEQKKYLHKTNEYIRVHTDVQINACHTVYYIYDYIYLFPYR